MYRKTLVPLLAALALAACEDTAGPESGLSPAEVSALSEAMIDADYAVTGEVAAADAESDAVAFEPITATTTFTATRTCPAGGQVVREGTHIRVWDRATHTGYSDLSMTKTHQDCARIVGDVTLTVNGDPNIAVEAHHEWAEGQRHGLQTLDIEGALTWSTDDGREGACTIHLSASFDPDTRTRTVSGTFCDRAIERTTTWQMGGMGGHGGA